MLIDCESENSGVAISVALSPNADGVRPHRDAEGDSRPLRSKRLKILYALGPGDVVGLYRDLQDGKKPAFQPGMAFSKQFLDWCDESGAEAHVISSHARRDEIRVGPHRVENRPYCSWRFGGGLKFHLGTIFYGLAIVARALRDRANLVIADAGTTHWIVFSLFAVLRTPVIAVLHNTLWPMGVPPKRSTSRFLLSLDGFFFRRIASATVCVSPECERQVRKIAGAPKGRIYQCRAQYRENFLSRVSLVPQRPFCPFQVLFLGRIEEAKGVFLILSMAERLEKELPGRFAWKIVGSGPASDALERQVLERRLGGIVEVPGRLSTEQTALETFGWAHALVVPTTSRFAEGLAMVAVEAVLTSRPVVVSAVVPAWEILGDAAIVADTDSVASFVAAFRKLALDPDYYDRCRRATRSVQDQFYDRSQGIGAVLGRAIADLA
jgi:glycogen(starch) synthase